MRLKQKAGVYLLKSIIVLATCISLQVPAFAKELLLLAGAEGGNGKSYNYYTYAGIIAPLGNEHFGTGFFQRYWLDVYGYDYPTGTASINVSAIGAEAALGYQIAWRDGWANTCAGLRYAHTWLSPDRLDNKVRGNQLRVKVQSELEQTFAETIRFNLAGNYIIESNAYWARLRTLFHLQKELFTGPEMAVMGDSDYRAWQYGWTLMGIELLPKGYVGIKAGARTTEHADTGWYFGVEFSKSF